MAKKTFDEQQLRRMYYDEHKTIKEIAAELDTTSSTLRRAFKEFGIQATRDRASRSFDVEEVKRLYLDENLTKKEVAAKLGVGLSTIVRFLDKHNIKKDLSAVVETRERTMVDRYGVAHALESEEFLDKVKQTNLEHRGTEWAMQSEEVREKSRRTSLERYGIEHASSNEDAKARRAATNLARYGAENPLASEEIQEKIKQTNLSRYGVENPSQIPGFGDKIRAAAAAGRYGEPRGLQSEETKEKRRQTNIEKYGTDNPLGNPDIRRKAQETIRERYGVDHISQSDEFKKKFQDTSLKRYGTKHPMQSPEVLDRVKKSNMDKYGVEWSFQDEEVRTKGKQTNLEKYGDEIPSRTEEIKEKTRETNLSRYGVENPSQVEEFKEKRRRTMVERFGVPYAMQNEEVKKKLSASLKASMQRKYNVENPIQKNLLHFDEWSNAELFRKRCLVMEEELGRLPHAIEIAQYFNSSVSIIYPKIHEYECDNMVSWNISYIEDQWRDWCQDSGIPCEPRPVKNLLKDEDGKRYEIDIFIPSMNIGVEIDPTVTHNSTMPYSKKPPKDSHYHQKKSQLAESQGINLIHIFDFYDEDKMKSLLLSLCGKNTRIYARNTIVEPITDAKVEKAFLEENHLQGYIKSSVCYGLYTRKDHDLVAVMSFGSPRYGNIDNAEYEMLRFCSMSGITVVGGASKLFTAFLRDHDPSSVMSFANYDISNGNMYEKLGFDFVRYTTPSYTWVSLDDPSITYSWYVVMKKGVDNLLGTDYGKGVSNIAVMEEHGFVRVYNSGNKVYIWRRDTQQ